MNKRFPSLLLLEQDRGIKMLQISVHCGWSHIYMKHLVKTMYALWLNGMNESNRQFSYLFQVLDEHTIATGIVQKYDMQTKGSQTVKSVLGIDFTLKEISTFLHRCD